MQAKVARNQTSTFLVLRKAEQGSNRGAEYRREDGIASSWRTRMCSMKQEAKTSAKAKLWYFTIRFHSASSVLFAKRIRVSARPTCFSASILL